MNLMSEADYRLGRARKERLESEGVNPQDLDQETIAELLQVISMEVVVGEFSLWDRQVLGRAAELLTTLI